MTVSVVIPAYNAAKTLPLALRALRTQDYPDPVEIIVVDDGSTDETFDRVREEFQDVVCLRQSNMGPAGARNAGAAAAKGDFLCFTDSDCVPHADWISWLMQGFVAPDIGVVCGSYGIANKESLLARGIHGEIIFRHERLMPDYPKAFGSYNFCVRKEVFNQVGGFQQGYRQASGEDNDLSYRILAAGSRIYFQRKALVDHYHTTRLMKYLKEQFRHGFWRARMYLEHPGMIKGDDYTFWKDMVEVPWAMGIALLMIAVLFVGRAAGYPFLFLLAAFLIFEIFFSVMMLKNFFEGIFYGCVMYLRAFSRAFGLSTGFFYFFMPRQKKNF